MTSTRSLSVSLNLSKSAVFNTNGYNYHLTEYSKNKLIEYHTQNVWHISENYRLFSVEFVKTDRENTGGYLVFQYSFKTSADALSVTIPTINVIGPTVFTGVYEVDGNYVGGNYLDSDLFNAGNNRYARPSIYVSKSDSWMTSPLYELPDPQYNYNYSYTSDYGTMTFPVDPSTTYYVYLTVPAGFKMPAYTNKSVHFLSEYFESVTETYKTDAISCSISIDGETATGTEYKISPGQHTVTYSVTSDYSWSGTLKIGSSTYSNISTSGTKTYTFTASGWTSTKTVSFSVSNGYKTASASKTYHIGTTPTAQTGTDNAIVTINQGAWNATYTKTFTGYGNSVTVGTITSSSTTVVNSVTNVSVSVSGSTYTLTYKYNNTAATAGTSTITIPITDEYGTVNCTYTATVKLKPDVSFNTPSMRVGEQATFTNTSTNVTGAKYTWSVDGTDVAGYIGVSSTTNLVYTFNDSNQHTVKLKGYITVGAYDYANEASNTVQADNPLPTPTFVSPASVIANTDFRCYCTNSKRLELNYLNCITLNGETTVQATWYIDNTKVSSGFSFDTRILSSGTHTIKLVFTDGVFTNEASKSIEVINPIPVPTFTVTPGTRYVTKDIWLTCTNPTSTDNTYLEKGYLNDFYYFDKYVWYVDNSVYANGPKVNIHISTVGNHTIKLRLYKDGIYRDSAVTTINVLTIAPALSFTYEPSQDITKGTVLKCTNTSTEIYDTNPTYSWTVNGTVYTSRDCTFVVGSSPTLSVTLRGSVGVYQSTPLTVNIPIIPYVDPNTRFTIAVFNGNNVGVFTRNQTDCMFTGLHFEKRLNEVGSGSVKVMIPNSTTQYQTGALVQGSDIIIFDELTPVYYGIVTSVSTVNNIPFGREVTKTLIDVEFAEATRKLSTVQCTNNEIVPDASVKTICDKIVPAEYRGDFDNGTTRYTFTVSNSDVLSQLDSFNDQSNCRYICRPNIRISGRTGLFTHSPYYGDGIADDSPFASETTGYIFMKEGNNVLFGLCEKYASNVMKFTSHIKCGFPSSFSSKYVLGKGFVIDNKQSYYQVSSVIPTDNYQLVVNKTCYDVDNVDNLNKCYGKVVCTSPQDSGLNVVCEIPLNSIVNPDGTLNNCAYIVESDDTTIYDSQYSGFEGRYDLYVYGTYTKAQFNELLFRYSNGTYDNVNANAIKNTTINSRNLTFSKAAWWIGVGYSDENYRDIIGDPLVTNKYKLSNSLTGDMTFMYIGGQYVEGSYNSTTGIYTVDLQAGSDTITFPGVSHKVGALIQKSYAATGSPMDKYPDKILSVTLQRNMNYAEVELIASTIARYGSNFTSTCNGTCNIKYWKNRLTSTLPLPGDHIKMKYNDTDTMDYELVSYTVNCDTMSVDFNVGMQPLNVGDVIYRLNQNMTTNITTQ